MMKAQKSNNDQPRRGFLVQLFSNFHFKNDQLKLQRCHGETLIFDEYLTLMILNWLIKCSQMNAIQFYLNGFFWVQKCLRKVIFLALRNIRCTVLHNSPTVINGLMGAVNIPADSNLLVSERRLSVMYNHNWQAKNCKIFRSPKLSPDVSHI